MLNEAMLALGVMLLAPGQCALLHASRTRGCPFPRPWRRSQKQGARFGVLASLVLSAVVLNGSGGLALALVLPLAALSTAGMLYVPAVHAWPRTTLWACMGSSAAALALVTTWTRCLF